MSNLNVSEVKKGQLQHPNTDVLSLKLLILTYTCASDLSHERRQLSLIQVQTPFLIHIALQEQRVHIAVPILDQTVAIMSIPYYTKLARRNWRVATSKNRQSSYFKHDLLFNVTATEHKETVRIK